MLVKINYINVQSSYIFYNNLEDIIFWISYINVKDVMNMTFANCLEYLLSMVKYSENDIFQDDLKKPRLYHLEGCEEEKKRKKRIKMKIEVL